MDYYYIENGVAKGPLSKEEIRHCHITPKTLVWVRGMSEWQPAEKVAEFQEILYGPQPEKPGLPELTGTQTIITPEPEQNNTVPTDYSAQPSGYSTAQPSQPVNSPAAEPHRQVTPPPMPHENYGYGVNGQQYGQPYQQPQQGFIAPINNHRSLCIVGTVLASLGVIFGLSTFFGLIFAVPALICGIIGITKASNCDAMMRANNLQGARQAAQSAKTLGWISVIFFLVSIVLILMLLFVWTAYIVDLSSFEDSSLYDF